MCAVTVAGCASVKFIAVEAPAAAVDSAGASLIEDSDAGDDTARPMDTADTADSGDSGAPPADWVTLPSTCVPPSPSGTDAFVEVGAEINQSGSWFTEILDVAYLPDAEVVLTAGQGGVAVFDLSDVTQPNTRGHLGAEPGPFERYYHVEPAAPERMFATHRDIGLDVISYADPDRLVRTARMGNTGYEGLHPLGDRLYVANINGSIDIFNITVTDAIAFSATVSEGLERPWDILATEDAAYVADGGAGLVTFSLASRDAPVWTATADSEGQPVRLVGDDDGYLYVASGSGGLEIFETSDPLAPTRVAVLDVGGSALDVEVHDGIVGVTTQEAVVLFDVGRAGTPEAPVPFAYEETELYAMALTAADGRWLVGDWNILSVWELGTDPAPSIDVSSHGVAFLDEAETRIVRVTNRGSAALTIAGIALPPGMEATIDHPVMAPGQVAQVQVAWDGVTGIPRGSTICIASDDPGMPQFELQTGTGASGEGNAIGQNAPDFALEDLDGVVHRLSDQIGQPVVLAYFATW
ncbi:MAG TPA: hypothetical protein DFR83_08310 [Deltaproteobacteria bacterium]|nr:hypothetical protein [Deltaproteobacteria bacterium]